MTEIQGESPISPALDETLVHFSLPRLPCAAIEWGQGKIPGVAFDWPCQALFVRRSDSRIREQVGYLCHLPEGIAWFLTLSWGDLFLERRGLCQFGKIAAERELIDALMPYLMERRN